MNEPLETLLYRALQSPMGIVIETNDADRLRQKLYPVRKTQPIFEPLAFILSPLNPGQLWIVRKPDHGSE